jgi:hypothetical protein
VVTVPVGPPGQSLRSAQHGATPLVRPRALTAATPLLLAAVLPVLLLGAAAACLPERRWLPYIGPWPRVHAGQFGYRVLGVCVLMFALGYVVVVVLAHRRRHWARTSAVTLTALGDPALVMLLLADVPWPAWLLGGAAVVLTSLAGVACCYQPEVDRYLAHQGRHAW